tara:strand:+ start:136 stop:300 length:165 start_codon:yes stop_codon:yes gene_type:complete
MIDFYDYLNAEDESKNDFTKSFKDEITARVFTRLEDIKKDMANDFLKSDENESS